MIPVFGIAQPRFSLNVARGLVSGMSVVNKFGRAPNGVQPTATDIWDRADASPTQSVWVAPTSARIHQIVSTSASDASAGVGARTIQIFGLTSWGVAEVSEIVTLNGLTNVATVNAYVIIHRMVVLTKGATSVNVGSIRATADTDTTVTAQIRSGAGQTQMTIYGVPSNKVFYMDSYYASINSAGGVSVDIVMSLLCNTEPEVELTNFVTIHTLGVQNDGNSHFHNPFNNPLAKAGPCILKISGVASTTDIDCSAGFTGILSDI